MKTNNLFKKVVSVAVSVAIVGMSIPIMASAGNENYNAEPSVASSVSEQNQAQNEQTQAEPSSQQQNTVSNSASNNVGKELGAFIVTKTDGSGDPTDSDASYASGVLTIKSNTPMTISNKDSSTQTSDRIDINSDANVTFAGINISTSSNSAVVITTDAHVIITLKDDTTNILSGQPTGLRDMNGGGDLTIQGEPTGKGTGILIAQGQAENTWGIESLNNLTINGGTVTSFKSNGYGIHGGNLVINGGTVTTNIYSNYISITGGTVTTTGSAGIYAPGSGTINGDTVVVASSLSGFDSGLIKGVVFNGTSGTVYGNVDLPDSVEFPTYPLDLNGGTLTVPSGKTLTLNGGLTDSSTSDPKSGTLENRGTVEINTALTNEAKIFNNSGTITVNADLTNGASGTIDDAGTITCSGSAAVKTVVGFTVPTGDPSIDNRTYTYQDKDGTKTYIYTSGNASWTGLPEGYTWYYEDPVTSVTEVKNDTKVYLNVHAMATNITSTGDFNVTRISGKPVLSTDVSWDGTNRTLSITSNTPMTISNKNLNTPTSDRIVIDSGATLTFAGINIVTGSGSAVQITSTISSDVTIILADNAINALTATSDGDAGLKTNGQTYKLTIQGTGQLTATGGAAAAGIGGSGGGNGSNIEVAGGIVTATGGSGAAGIGGGTGGDGSNIEIKGGIVEATGGTDASGIGGGQGSSGSSGNKVNGNTVVVASSLDGFADSDLTQGVVFNGTSGTVYGSVSLPDSVEFPAYPLDLNGNTLTVPEGKTLTLNGGLTDSSTSDPKTGTLTNSGTVEIDTALTNEAKITNAGTINVNADLTNGASGTIDNAGTLTVSATLNNGGTLNNNTGGTITNNDGGTLSNSGTLTNNATLTNDGTLTNDTGGTLTNNVSGTITNAKTLTNNATLNNSGTLTNNTGGTLTNNVSGTITNTGTITVNGTLGNSGQLTNDTGGTIDVNADLTNTGTLDNSNGTINIAADKTIHNGTETNQAGTIEEGNNITFNSGSAIKTYVGFNISSGTAPTPIEYTYKTNSSTVSKYKDSGDGLPAGYTWGYETASENGSFVVVDDDSTVLLNTHTLTGRAETYTVEYKDVANEGTVSGDSSATYNAELTVTTKPKDGYEATGVEYSVDGGTNWNDAGVTKVGDNQYKFTVPAVTDSNKKLYVRGVFVGNSHTVTIPAFDNGSVTADKKENIAPGEEVTLTVDPSDGYQLKDGSLKVTYGESGEIIPVVKPGTDNQYTFKMPADNVTVEAEFEGTPHIITIPDMEHGSVTAQVVNESANNLADGSTVEVKTGDTVKLTVTPDDGYQLKEGSLKVTDSEGKEVELGSDNTFVVPDSDITVEAEFESNSPSPTPTPAPTPTPTPTPDDGGGTGGGGTGTGGNTGGNGAGSGANATGTSYASGSAKTGDNAMAGVAGLTALAGLGVAVMLRKRRR